MPGTEARMNMQSTEAQPAWRPWIVDRPAPAKEPHNTVAKEPHNTVARASAAKVYSSGECNRSNRDRSRTELAQRGRLMLDVAMADLEAAQRAFGPSHSTTWYFHTALDETRRSWERLRLELGTAFLETALRQLPLVVLGLRAHQGCERDVELILISGQTYCSQAVGGTVLAPVQWRLTRLNPPLAHGPYYVCRLADGSTQCDCANWTYRVAETEHSGATNCKHVEALIALGRI
jgi:hypothetical protein